MMKVHVNVLGDVHKDGPEENSPAGQVDTELVFFTGTSRSAVAFVKAVDGEGKALDEILLQINDKGRLTLHRKREI